MNSCIQTDGPGIADMAAWSNGISSFADPIDDCGVRTYLSS